MDNLVELFGFPDKVKLLTKVTKKVVLESNSLTAFEKKLIKDEISEITWLAVIKPNTYNIPQICDENYIYDEITYIVISIINPTKAKKIVELFQKIIPYQLIVIIKYNDEVLINVADKRINKSDKEKRTVEKMVYTDWFKFAEIKNNNNTNAFFESLKITNLPHQNLKAFYSGIINRVNCYIISKRTEKYKIYDETITLQLIEMLEEIKKKEDIIKSIRKEIKT